MSNHTPSQHTKFPHRLPILIIAIGLLFVTGISLACNAPASEATLKETQIALDVQGTQLALEASKSENNQSDQNDPVADIEATQTAQDATQIALDVQATINAQAASETNVTDTQFPTDPPPPTNTAEAPTAESPSAAEPVDIDTMMKDANILLFENVTKVPLPRYIQQALNNLGLSRNYVDVKDAPGNFKAELLSGKDWDLIIVGVEERSSIQGEFFDYFNEQVNKGTALVLEIWNLNEISGPKANAFMTNCGVKLQSDWFDPPMTARSIWWLYGEHPVFHEPNEGMSLVNYAPYWSGDAGDLLKTVSGGDADMLAGIYAQEKNSYGVLAICHDDRVIIQTYSSHDYRQDDVVRLWENYIYNTLRAHFEYELSK
jgi:hypothetical protein